tara:strand:+ start:56 stop:283 length:228 start_codon:yes stop_codon:yes gene_type:complete
MGLLKKFAKSILENLADGKDDNKEKEGQGLSRDEAVKKVQNNPVFKAEEARIRKNLDELNEEYAEIEKRLERHQR